MMTLPSLLYRGSVKNIRGDVSPSVDSPQHLLFEYSDRYSVFDWGEMPDQLIGKGRALSIMGKLFFRYLENPLNWTDLFSRLEVRQRFTSSFLEKCQQSAEYERLCSEGLTHHYLGDEDNAFDSAFMKIKRIDVIRPVRQEREYDYSPYRQRVVNTLVPLEMIFRLGLPPGNSLSKRLGFNPVAWREFGLKSVPREGDRLDQVVLDFSTKLERGDRYLEASEAKRLSGMSDEEWRELSMLINLIALNLYSLHHCLGLDLWDGKLEMAFVEKDQRRSFMLVDSIGIDELRLLCAGKSFSKEFLREHYKNSQWYRHLEEAKKEAQMRGLDFKKLCQEKYHSSPEALPLQVLERALFVYKAYCNSLALRLGLNAPIFPGNFTIEEYQARYL